MGLFFLKKEPKCLGTLDYSQALNYTLEMIHSQCHSNSNGENRTAK